MLEKRMWTLAGASARLRCGPLDGSVQFATLPAIWTTLALAGNAADRSAGECPLLRVNASAVDAPALQWKLVDRYVRKTTLSIAYETDDGLLRFHLDWRLAEATADGATLDVVASLQTETLGIEPQVLIASQVPYNASVELARTAADGASAKEGPNRKPLRPEASARERPGRWQTMDAGQDISGRAALLPTFGGADWHYCELALPDDFQASTSPGREAFALPAVNASRVLWTNAGETLEKGVLRRFRFRAIWRKGTLSTESSQAAAELERHWGEFVLEPLPLTA